MKREEKPDDFILKVKLLRWKARDKIGWVIPNDEFMDDILSKLPKGDKLNTGPYEVVRSRIKDKMNNENEEITIEDMKEQFMRHYYEMNPEEEDSDEESDSVSEDSDDGHNCKEEHGLVANQYEFQGNCYNCREWGHRAQDCPHKNYEEERSNYQVRMCYYCGLPGHLQFECQKKMADKINGTYNEEYDTTSYEGTESDSERDSDGYEEQANANYEIVLNAVPTNAVKRETCYSAMVWENEDVTLVTNEESSEEDEAALTSVDVGLPEESKPPDMNEEYTITWEEVMEEIDEAIQWWETSSSRRMDNEVTRETVTASSIDTDDQKEATGIVLNKPNKKIGSMAVVKTVGELNPMTANEGTLMTCVGRTQDTESEAYQFLNLKTREVVEARDDMVIWLDTKYNDWKDMFQDETKVLSDDPDKEMKVLESLTGREMEMCNRLQTSMSFDAEARRENEPRRDNESGRESETPMKTDIITGWQMDGSKPMRCNGQQKTTLKQIIERNLSQMKKGKDGYVEEKTFETKKERIKWMDK